MARKMQETEGKKKLTLSKNALIIIILALVVLSVVIMNFIASAYTRDVVKIAVLKSGVNQNDLITEDMVTQKEMQKQEYLSYKSVKLANEEVKEIIPWEKRSIIFGAYAQHFIKGNAPIYWDNFTKTIPKDHKYLYEMDGEFLRLEGVDPQMFGEILIPGDKVNIRVTYEDSEFKLPTEEEYLLFQQTGMELNSNVTVQKKLFNSATLIDMLNGDNESIFDIYSKVLAMPKKQQTEYLANEEYKAKITPVTICLIVTSEEVDEYQDVSSKGADYLMTLLPRKSSNNLLVDALAELQDRSKNILSKGE